MADKKHQRSSEPEEQTHAPDGTLATEAEQEPVPEGPRFYHAERNPDGGVLPGVPLADLSAEWFAQQPDYIQRSVDALPFYLRSRPRTTRSDEQED